MEGDKQAFLERLRVTNPNMWEALRPRPEQPPSTQLCRHEAAHAALMHAFGRKIEFARAGEFDGAVQPDRVDRLNSDEALKRPINLVAMILAGDMAAGDEEPLTRDQWLNLIRLHVTGEKIGLTTDVSAEATSDQRHAVYFAHLAAVLNDVDAIYGHIVDGWNRAVDLLNDKNVWASIVALTHALRAEHHISGERVHEILAQHIQFGAYK